MKKKKKTTSPNTQRSPGIQAKTPKAVDEDALSIEELDKVSGGTKVKDTASTSLLQSCTKGVHINEALIK